MRSDWRARLDVELDASQGYQANNADWLDGRWADIKAARDYDDPRAAHRRRDRALEEIGEKITAAPKASTSTAPSSASSTPRAKSIETGEGIDWATGEALAFCSLLLDGRPVRLSARTPAGTFSQRHSVLVDQETRTATSRSITCARARPFEVINSMLSKRRWSASSTAIRSPSPTRSRMGGAVRRFRQRRPGGVRPVRLIEAAQVAAHVGLGLPAPHGYEGQGPEHSSARLERFLQMCAEDNMQVANCTTPANYFHILRRQLKRDIRKPLILMTPKSLLRHKRAVSRLDEMGPGTTFHRLLWDDAQLLPNEKIKLVADDKIRRVVMCSGKVYYDLYEEREKRGIDDVYLLRIEQALPGAQGAGAGLGRFPKAQHTWCQEEPRNMGAYSFMQPYLEWVLDQIGAARRQPLYAGRPASAATWPA